MRLGWLILGFLVWHPGEAEQFAPIVEIRFEGNRHTEPRIMLQEMSVKVGDPADPQAIEVSRQSIMDLGLFQTVRTELEERADGIAVVMHVEEKFYVLPLPLLDAREEGEISYGVELRFDNLMGLNQRLKLGYENESESGENNLRRKYSVDYRYPRLFGSAYQLDLGAKFKQEELTEHEDFPELPAGYGFDEKRFDFDLTRWLEKHGPSRGWRAGGGLSFIDHQYEYHGGVPGLFEDSGALTMRGTVEFVDVHEYPYYRKGVAYGWNGEWGLPELGSDHQFSRHLFYWRSYQPLGLGDRDPDLNIQLRLGLASGTLFGDRAFTVGGGKTLRGYDESDEGNAMLLANVEYLVPMPHYPQLRGVLFVDAGNVYPTIEDIDPASIEMGTGVGFRWKVQSFVDITLSADVGYGLGSGQTKFYASTSATF